MTDNANFSTGDLRGWRLKLAQKGTINCIEYLVQRSSIIEVVCLIFMLVGG